MTESMTVTDSLVKGMYISFNSHEWRISSALFVDPEKVKQVAFQSNANHPLAESTDYIKFEGM